MLYVFHVDRGMLVTFDMQLSVAYVDKLKEEIERLLGIPVDKQVLMMSGGHCLENHARVCSFGTGTDTNPVYLFSRELAESPDPPKPIPDPTPDIDLREQTEAASNLPASYNTVVTRSQLAQKFHELSREQHRICERLVLDQHRQHQGWAAVAANLEDLVNEFRKRADAFLKIYQSQQEKIERYKIHLQSFRNNLELLNKIPVIPALLNKRKEKFDTPNVPMLTEVAYDEEQQTTTTTTKTTDTTVAEEHHSAGESSSSTSSAESSASSSSDDDESEEEIKPMSLLQWVSMKDSQFTLEQVAYDCDLLMAELSEKCIEQWKNEKDITLNYIENYPLKEISGLGDRLFGLERLMRDAEKLVTEQADLAHSFVQNQNRASNLGDPSILPDLCASHRRQLTVMLQNYNSIRDIRRRCNKAKEELCINLHKRLGWVLTGEKKLLECDYKLSTFTSKQKHLDYLLGVLDQIQQAPEMYLSAVIEVVRRRQFSQAFLTWASDLACHLTSIHSDEIMRRTDFQVEFEEHFLNALFTGLNDMPPSYATEPPSLFDINLPPLTIEDIEMVREKIPEVAEKLKMPDFTALTQFFQSKSISGVKFEERGVGDDRCIEDRLVQVVTDAGLGSALDRGLLRATDSQTSGTSSHLAHHHLKDFDRGFESETDTEEFEKVGQSPVELQFENKTNETPAPRNVTLDASTLTEGHQMPPEFVTTEYYIDESMPSSLSTDGGGSLILPPAELMRQLDDSNNVVALLQDNLATSKHEIKKLKEALQKACEIATMSVDFLRSNLTTIKSNMESEKDVFTSHCASILDAWNKFQNEVMLREREKIQRLTVDHELEMNDIKKLAIAKDDEIRSLKIEKIDTECIYSKRLGEATLKLEETEAKLKQSLLRCEELEKELETTKIDNEKATVQLREQLQREHQSDMESLRSRFRLMTVANMERSPSDTSLERIDRIDVIELVNHESIIAQLKENFVQEQERAVKDAVDKERDVLTIKLEELRQKFQDERQLLISDAVRKIREEKDRQIENLIAREEVLSRECRKYKEVIQQLTDNQDMASQETVQPLLSKIDQLQQDKCRLEAELSLERSRRLMMSGPALPFSMAQSMGASVAVCQNLPIEMPRPSTCDASTSTDNRVHRMLSSSQLALIQAYNININVCAVGERVLVVWDKNFQNYVLVLDSSSIYVLHAECIPVLGLKPPNEATKKDKAVGEVIEKEYCYAKKTENRYHFPKGTRFYRVKVKPLSEDIVAAVRRDNSNPSGHSSMETSTTSMHAETSSLNTKSEETPTESSGELQHQGVVVPRAMSQSYTHPTTTCSKTLLDNEDSDNSTARPPSSGSSYPTSSPPYLSRSLFGGISTSSRGSSFTIYHSLSQPSSLVSCSGDNRPTESPQVKQETIEDEVDTVNVLDEKDR